MRIALLTCLAMLCLLATGFPAQAGVAVNAASPDELVQQVAAQVKARLALVEIEPLGFWPAVRRSAFVVGRYEIEIPEPQGGAHERLEVRVMRSVQEGAAVSQPEESGRVRLAIHRLEQAWVAQAMVPAGVPLSCESRFQRRLQHVRVERAVQTGGCEAWQGQELRRPLSPGDVLMAADLRQPPAVRSHATVRATVVSNGVEIQAAALALQDAVMGQRLWIRPMGAVSAIKARVVGVDNVMVE